MGDWMIQLQDPNWSGTVHCRRRFETPEAAASYAHSLVEHPEIWVSQEGSLCRLLEASDPDKVRIRITLGG